MTELATQARSQPPCEANPFVELSVKCFRPGWVVKARPQPDRANQDAKISRANSAYARDRSWSLTYDGADDVALTRLTRYSIYVHVMSGNPRICPPTRSPLAASRRGKHQLTTNLCPPPDDPRRIE